MAFADELKKKSTNYNPDQEKINIVSSIVNRKVKECIYGIKDLCSKEAQKGKTSISGYLSVGYEEYDPNPTVRVWKGSFEPHKDTSGTWSYTPTYSFDYGINKSVFENSNEDRLKIALLIKDGILNGLKIREDGHVFGEYTPHSLRHTFATRGFEKGIPPRLCRKSWGISPLQ